jgi:hypothetical protein
MREELIGVQPAAGQILGHVCKLRIGKGKVLPRTGHEGPEGE